MKTDIDASSFNLDKYWVILQILYYVYKISNEKLFYNKS